LQVAKQNDKTSWINYLAQMTEVGPLDRASDAYQLLGIPLYQL
jgi:hypothetical protein